MPTQSAHSRRCFLLTTGLLLCTTGCYSVPYRPPPEPLAPEEVIEMSQAGAPPEDIIQAIRDSRTIYRMDAKDVVNLSREGVDERVIDFMMNTERRHRERERRYYAPYWRPWPWHYPHFPHAAYYCW